MSTSVARLVMRLRRARSPSTIAAALPADLTKTSSERLVNELLSVPLVQARPHPYTAVYLGDALVSRHGATESAFKCYLYAAPNDRIAPIVKQLSSVPASAFAATDPINDVLKRVQTDEEALVALRRLDPKNSSDLIQKYVLDKTSNIGGIVDRALQATSSASLERVAEDPHNLVQSLSSSATSLPTHDQVDMVTQLLTLGNDAAALVPALQAPWSNPMAIELLHRATKNISTTKDNGIIMSWAVPLSLLKQGIPWSMQVVNAAAKWDLAYAQECRRMDVAPTRLLESALFQGLSLTPNLAALSLAPFVLPLSKDVPASAQFDSTFKRSVVQPGDIFKHFLQSRVSLNAPVSYPDYFQYLLHATSVMALCDRLIPSQKTALQYRLNKFAVLGAANDVSALNDELADALASSRLQYRPKIYEAFFSALANHSIPFALLDAMPHIVNYGAACDEVGVPVAATAVTDIFLSACSMTNITGKNLPTPYRMHIQRDHSLERRNLATKAGRKEAFEDALLNCLQLVDGLKKLRNITHETHPAMLRTAFAACVPSFLALHNLVDTVVENSQLSSLDNPSLLVVMYFARGKPYRFDGLLDKCLDIFIKREVSLPWLRGARLQCAMRAVIRHDYEAAINYINGDEDIAVEVVRLIQYKNPWNILKKTRYLEQFSKAIDMPIVYERAVRRLALRLGRHPKTTLPLLARVAPERMEDSLLMVAFSAYTHPQPGRPRSESLKNRDERVTSALQMVVEFATERARVGVPLSVNRIKVEALRTLTHAGSLRYAETLLNELLADGFFDEPDRVHERVAYSVAHLMIRMRQSQRTGENNEDWSLVRSAGILHALRVLPIAQRRLLEYATEEGCVRGATQLLHHTLGVRTPEVARSMALYNVPAALTIDPTGAFLLDNPRLWQDLDCDDYPNFLEAQPSELIAARSQCLAQIAWKVGLTDVIGTCLAHEVPIPLPVKVEMVRQVPIEEDISEFVAILAHDETDEEARQKIFEAGAVSLLTLDCSRETVLSASVLLSLCTTHERSPETLALFASRCESLLSQPRLEDDTSEEDAVLALSPYLWQSHDTVPAIWALVERQVEPRLPEVTATTEPRTRAMLAFARQDMTQLAADPEALASLEHIDPRMTLLATIRAVKSRRADALAVAKHVIRVPVPSDLDEMRAELVLAVETPDELRSLLAEMPLDAGERTLLAFLECSPSLALPVLEQASLDNLILPQVIFTHIADDLLRNPTTHPSSVIRLLRTTPYEHRVHPSFASVWARLAGFT